MLSAKPFQLPIASIVSLIFFVTGCTDHQPTASTEGEENGWAEFSVSWPSRSLGRGLYIPPYAESLYFDMHDVDTPGRRYQFFLNRPTTEGQQVATVERLLPVGSYAIACVARLGSGGQGTTVASASATFPVSANERFSVTLVLETLLSSLQIQSAQQIPKGFTHNPKILAQTVQGNEILLVPRWLSYTTGAPELLSANVDGSVTGLAAGPSILTVNEPGAHLSSRQELTVVEENEPEMVWISGHDESYGVLDLNSFEYEERGRFLDANDQGRINMSDIAWGPRPQPVFWGCTHHALYRVDPETGYASKVMDFDVGDRITGLTSLLDGKLLAAGKFLWEIDPTGPTIRKVSEARVRCGGDIDQGRNDRHIYIASSSGNLLVADRLSGTVTDLGDLGLGKVWALHQAGGRLFAIEANTKAMFEVSMENPTTVVPVGTLPENFSDRAGGSASFPR